MTMPFLGSTNASRAIQHSQSWTGCRAPSSPPNTLSSRAMTSNFSLENSLWIFPVLHFDSQWSFAISNEFDDVFIIYTLTMPLVLRNRRSQLPNMTWYLHWTGQKAKPAPNHAGSRPRPRTYWAETTLWPRFCHDESVPRRRAILQRWTTSY